MMSQSAEYALRAVIVLARAHGKSLTTEVISKDARVSSGYLAKMMQALARANIVTARRGVHGGYTLAIPPDRLTVLRVIRAVDQSRRITRCPLSLASHTCPCTLHRKIDEAAAMMDGAYEKTCVAELLDGPIQTLIEAVTPPAPDAPGFASATTVTASSSQATQ